MIKLLDCTLRDGGYTNNWAFGKNNISKVIQELTNSNFDIIEIGYLNKDANDPEKSIFRTIEDASRFIPQSKTNTTYLAMADVGRFLPENITPYKEGLLDGIRVAFYKHQTTDALELCQKVLDAGYKLFVQPMVTADYTEDEYSILIDQIINLKPFAVSIVDSFGYMTKEELARYFKILDTKLDKDCMIGFHAHNNMQLAVLNAQSLFDYTTDRTIIIDSSICGIGRGAGNLSTELIASYYNQNIHTKYNVDKVITLINDIIYPIYQKTPWGYSPYFYLTARYHCHPNYATYILSKNTVSVTEFEQFLKTITDEYRTKCRKDTALEFFATFRNNNQK